MIGKAPIPAKNRFLQRDNDNSDDDDDADADIPCHHASNQGPAHARTLGRSRSLGLGGLCTSRRMRACSGRIRSELHTQLHRAWAQPMPHLHRSCGGRIRNKSHIQWGDSLAFQGSHMFLTTHEVGPSSLSALPLCTVR